MNFIETIQSANPFNNSKNITRLFGKSDVIQKAEDSDIEKAEGSRGGKIIGHTKSGKPIYEKHEQKVTSTYNSEDHSDALSQHQKKSKDYNEKIQKLKKNVGDKDATKEEDSKYQDMIEKREHHSSIAKLHSDAMNSKLDKESDKK